MNSKKIIALVLTFALAFSCMATLNAFADNSATLNTTTGSNTQDVIQNYTLTGTNGYLDVAKVNVSWTIADAVISYTSGKVWDDAKLEWKDAADPKDGYNITGGTAQFDFENRGTTDVTASVTYEFEEALSNAFDVEFTNDESSKAVPSVVDSESHAVGNILDASERSARISASVVLTDNGDSLEQIDDTDSATALVTYTITLADPIK